MEDRKIWRDRKWVESACVTDCGRERMGGKLAALTTLVIQYSCQEDAGNRWRRLSVAVACATMVCWAVEEAVRYLVSHVRGEARRDG